MLFLLQKNSGEFDAKPDDEFRVAFKWLKNAKSNLNFEFCAKGSFTNLPLPTSSENPILCLQH
jgi:hypothetical protein